MSRKASYLYTLMVAMCLVALPLGCGTGEPAPADAEAGTNEVPTVTMPDEDAGDSVSSAADEGASE